MPGPREVLVLRRPPPVRAPGLRLLPADRVPAGQEEEAGEVRDELQGVRVSGKC